MVLIKRFLWMMCAFVVLLKLNVIIVQAQEQRLAIIPLSSSESRPIVPQTTAILINSNDPDSQQLAKIYAARRGIPKRNIISVTLPITNVVTQFLFKDVISKIKQAETNQKFRAYVIAWQRPYRVGEQSITSALSLGMTGIKFKGNCNVTDVNPSYSLSNSADFPFSPSMMLIGGPDKADSLALAEKAGAGDGSNPGGTVYLVRTSDTARTSPRLASMIAAKLQSGSKIDVRLEEANIFHDASNIIGFETGSPVLGGLAGLSFLPGAYADHLTSFGGRLYDSRGQTAITEIMKAGATGSYGTVREPCNFPDKFPAPDIMLDRYLSGDSLIEAYWKSVRMITEGLFVGEPLARPFTIFDATQDGSFYRIRTTRLSQPGTYRFFRIETGVPIPAGRYTVPDGTEVGTEVARISIGKNRSADPSHNILGFVALDEK